MCLIVNKKASKRTAKKDIVVWKVLQEHKHVYYTAYMALPIYMHQTYKEDLGSMKKDGDEESYRIIEEGFHSLVHFSAAKNELSALKNLYNLIAEDENYHFVISKCIIPAGAKYYKGLYGGDESYVSNTIKYIEIVNHGSLPSQPEKPPSYNKPFRPPEPFLVP